MCVLINSYVTWHVDDRNIVCFSFWVSDWPQINDKCARVIDWQVVLDFDVIHWTDFVQDLRRKVWWRHILQSVNEFDCRVDECKGCDTVGTSEPDDELLLCLNIVEVHYRRCKAEVLLIFCGLLFSMSVDIVNLYWVDLQRTVCRSII